MQNVRFCELDFGSAIIEKKVRERAIAERIDVIRSSHSMKSRFEEQLREVKKRRMAKHLNMRENFVQSN